MCLQELEYANSSRALGAVNQTRTWNLMLDVMLKRTEPAGKNRPQKFRCRRGATILDRWSPRAMSGEEIAE
jgi:hypothetical protein